MIPHRLRAFLCVAVLLSLDSFLCLAAAEKPISFVNDVLPVLSKAGCNAGGCHGKPEGQNGFKLSVFAYDPKSDYQEITKASRGRRVFPGAPEASLLLLKPTMTVNHGGGLRLTKESALYQTLAAWIRQGMPYGSKGDPALKSIEVFPPERAYSKGATQELKVFAIYSDGSRREVTWLSEFRSNEKDLAQVSTNGLVTAGTISGEGVVIARFMGEVAISRVTIPNEKTLPDSLYAALPVHNEIDRLVYARLKKLGIAPSDACADGEFIRRASLDAIGRLPSIDETKVFLADTNAQKRSLLIDRLLADPNYADYWATKWADLIRPNPSRVGIKPVYLLDLWIRDSFRENKPYDRFVRELLTAEGSTHRYGPAAFFRDRREPVDLTTMVSQIFLGTRLECAKCHHHPNEKWSQTDFYQFASFFSEIKRKGQGISAPISGEAEFIYFAPGGEVKHPVTGEVLQPKAPDAPAAAIEKGKDPRAVLADWISRPDNPFFARATVNRIWAEFMGKGIVDPVDDFRASNLPSNEPLLDSLASHFTARHFDLKELMRTILQSHVYELSSLPNETNLADTRNYSRYYRRRLPAEALLDAVCDFTGVRERFEGAPAGARAVQTWNVKLDSEFMDAFGRPNASAECPCERDAKPSVVQALHMMNSNRLQAKLSNSEGRAQAWAASKLPDQELIREMYLSAYARFPEESEISAARKAFGSVKRKQAVEDVMWALVNSAEFVFNH